MHFHRKTTFFYCCILFSSNSSAQAIEEQINPTVSCPIPQYSQLMTAKEVEDENAFTIISKSSSIEKNQIALFGGGVTLINKAQTIKANKIEINRKNSTINAQGDIHFQNSGINIFADQLSASESSRATTLSNASYQLIDTAGHGSAGEISVKLDGVVSLIDSSYTTCYGARPDWKMQASEINLLRTEQRLEAYNTRFSVFNVPVLYLPYFSIPIGKERQSGFLYPNIGSSNTSGLQIELPYYLNISENMDATFTPRYMSKRGTQLLTEFRYLLDQQSGEINLEYLNKDDELIDNNDARYLARIQHTGTLSERFRANIDYTTISDDNYLVDLNSEQYNSNDAYLYQIGELSYFSDNWQATVQLQDFEVLGNHKPSYKTIPHIELSSSHPLGLANSRFDIYSEITRFESSNEKLANADRYHIEAGLSLPLSRPAWFLNSEFKILQTNYRQKNIPVNSQLQKNVSRTLPKVRFHGGINFDREMPYFGSGYTQTLEPQLQYLYIPSKEQNTIGVYDTTTLQDDYNGLFRDRRFSGLDRIAQANQYSWGVTSRVLSPSLEEVFRLSLGRIVYLNSSNSLANDPDEISADKSALASEIYFRLNDKWQFSGDIQYNTETSETNKGQGNVDYQINKNYALQLNHRYTRDVSGITLEQVSLLSNAKINKNWQLVGRIAQDLQQKHSIESYAGIQYSSCCWGVRFIYHRHINSNIDDVNFPNQNRDKFDNGFQIKFVYNGLNGGNSSNDIADMFNSSIFGYKRPYFLNN